MTKTQEELRAYAREYARKRRASDPLFLEKCREAGRKSREKRREIALQELAAWKSANKIKVSEYNKEYSLVRRKTDFVYRLKHLQRNRIRKALQNNWKAARSDQLLGCSYTELKMHIESKFVDNMSWDNMGEWHIDHIIPLASFDLSKEDQQYLAFGYKNLQPLWASDNLKKGSKHA